jgi:DNA-binding CsgD family transcriptional regulator
MEVARLLSTGASNAEIARDLVISPHTVKVHLRNIFEKLHVSSRTEASMLLIQRGWVVVPGVEVAPADALPQEPPPPPEPLPLRSTPLHVARWQIAYLLAAMLVSFSLVLLPNLVSLAQGPQDLLTDAGHPRSAPPNVRLEPRWELRTPLQTPLSRLGMAALDNRLYVVGGENSAGETVDTLAVYDLQTNDWTGAAALPLPLANVAVTAAAGRLFVAGGSSQASAGEESALVASLYTYNPQADRWAELAALPYPLAGAALVSDGAALYLIGGWDGRAMHDEIWRYPLAGETLAQPEAGGNPQAAWQLLGNLSSPRAFLGAAMVGGEIYIAGGYDGQRELDLAEVFTPATGERRQLPSLGSPRGGLALVYDGLGLYALGGGWTRTLSTHERYDTTTNAWSNFPSPIQGEWRNLGAAAVEGHLYLAGGFSGSPLDTHLDYQSSFRALLPVISNP